MKRTLLAFLPFLVLSHLSYAQWATTGTNINNTNTGNVGIGTLTPTDNLQIVTTTSATLGVSGSAGNIRDFRFETAGMPRWMLRSDGTAESGSNAGSDFNIIGRDDSGALLGAYFFIKRSTGSVGIGTTDPKGYKLAVNGSIIATSMTVKLNSAWPDYVFEKDYKLPSLQDVKTYIDQNQHLPEVPSEQEIAKDGLNLGKMNKLLMKKVEELTLYLIEMKSEIKELQKQNESLKKSK